jgi:hypothetical protein
MTFLLDADTLITGKNQAYGFDICPGFWDFIDREHAAGGLLSVKPVGDELKRGNDELAKWASKMGASFFRPLDTPTLSAMAEVAAWVQGKDFTDAAKVEFFRSADQYLIACAKAHGHIVVSHETLNRDQKSRVKIPVVCDAMGVRCIRTYDWLRSRGARFVL